MTTEQAKLATDSELEAAITETTPAPKRDRRLSDNDRRALVRFWKQDRRVTKN